MRATRLIAKSSLFSGILLGFPALCLAQMSESFPSTPSLSALESQASELESRRQWENALPLYFSLTQLDKANPEYREKLHLCLRHVLQGRRQRDKSFQEKLVSLTTAQAGALYEEVLEKLQNLYVDRSRSRVDRLFRAGLEELFSAFNDPEFREQHLKNVTPEQLEEFRQRIMEVWTDRPLKNPKEARLSATTIARTAHQQLGIKANCVMLEFICGACNSLDEYTAYLTPDDLDEENLCPDKSVIDAAILKEGVAYLRVTHFRDSTPAELDAAMNAFKGTREGRKLRGLILDFRGNAGGDFQAAVRFSERFLNRGVIATTTGQAAEANKIFSPNPGAPVLDIGLVVLVDSKTASAAEVVAHALRDQQRAKIVGMPTYGKGSIQKVFEFHTAQELDPTGKPRNRSGAIRITLARIFSPNGQPISGGLTPHILAASREQQLAIAVQEAGKFPLTMSR